jgi:D-serine deaminase-like pyridoxal phosphate-dependent protein
VGSWDWSGLAMGSSETAETVGALATPALLLDKDRLDRNLARLSSRMEARGVVLRPHMKTAKSIDVARRAHRSGPGPITVSTLAEAEYFAQHGFRDMTYAVGLAPHTAERAMRLRKAGVDLKVLLDSPEQARMLGAAGRAAGVTPSAFIEIDCDGHRGGLTATDPKLSMVAVALAEAGVTLAGILTHAGESYSLCTPEALAGAAENERAVAVAAAAELRAAGHECPVVSVGSTPTAHSAEDLTGVTEMRAGVYMFFDLVMHGVGVCTTDDIAISVLATVIGTKPEKGWILVDAGWMALSRDRGTAAQRVDQGYGLVCDLSGKVYADLIVAQASQEHGILAIRPGSAHALPHLSIGARVRILPNHACATASQHEAYNVVSAGSEVIQARWPRMRGW